jgi:hypothetical protein
MTNLFLWEVKYILEGKLTDKSTEEYRIIQNLGKLYKEYYGTQKILK